MSDTGITQSSSVTSGTVVASSVTSSVSSIVTSSVVMQQSDQPSDTAISSGAQIRSNSESSTGELAAVRDEWLDHHQLVTLRGGVQITYAQALERAKHQKVTYRTAMMVHDAACALSEESLQRARLDSQTGDAGASSSSNNQQQGAGVENGLLTGSDNHSSLEPGSEEKAEDTGAPQEAAAAEFPQHGTEDEMNAASFSQSIAESLNLSHSNPGDVCLPPNATASLTRDIAESLNLLQSTPEDALMEEVAAAALNRNIADSLELSHLNPEDTSTDSISVSSLSQDIAEFLNLSQLNPQNACIDQVAAAAAVSSSQNIADILNLTQSNPEDACAQPGCSPYCHMRQETHDTTAPAHQSAKETAFKKYGLVYMPVTDFIQPEALAAPTGSTANLLAAHPETSSTFLSKVLTNPENVKALEAFKSDRTQTKSRDRLYTQPKIAPPCMPVPSVVPSQNPQTQFMTNAAGNSATAPADLMWNFEGEQRSLIADYEAGMELLHGKDWRRRELQRQRQKAEMQKKSPF